MIFFAKGIDKPDRSILVMHFTLAVDDLAIGACLGQEQLFGQTMEDLAHMPRTTAVEAEGELVQVRLKVFGADIALMRGPEPPLEQGRDQMHMGEDLHRQLAIAPMVIWEYPAILGCHFALAQALYDL